eukprot:434359_1
MEFTHYYLVSIIFLSFLCLRCNGHTSIKVPHLSKLTAHQYHQLFATTYHDAHRNAAKHHIQLSDEFGNYIHLSYQSKHGSNTNILKLDEPHHQSNIHSLFCSSDANQNGIIALHVKSKSVAQQYYNDILSSISHPQKKHFIAAGHQWRCNQVILMQIIQIELNDTQLTLYTAHATLLDIFEQLSLSYESNINHHSHKAVDVTQHPKRRLTDDSFMSDLWSGVVNGLLSGIHYIQRVIESLSIPPLVKEFAEGERIEIGPRNITNKTWSWNHGQDAKKHLHISKNVCCKHCNSHLDAVYKYKMIIDRYTLQYLMMSVEGNATISGGIRLKGSSARRKEYRVNTPEAALFAFAAAGITFEADIYGQMGLGVHGNISEFSFNIGVTGYIEKGIEYNRSAQNKYNYINKHSLDFNKTQPHASLEEGNVTAYMRPSVNIQVKHVGSLFFGLQPTFNFNFSIWDTNAEKCVVHYTPSAKMNAFIGANLSLVHWHKHLDFTIHQSNLDNWAGCMDKKQVTRSQIWETTLNMVSINHTESPKARRVMDDATPQIQEAVTYLHYSDSNLIPRSSDEAQINSEYWANLTSIPEICSDYTEICRGYITEAIVPRIGRLMMSVQDGTLYGMYRTVNEIAPSNNWPFLNVTMITNVSCIARHRFDEVVFAQPYNDMALVTQYKVTLLEWYCDSDLSYFGINETANLRHYAGWECMISLPSAMYSIASDPSFGTIMLFDAPNWCHVFALSTKQQYILDTNQSDAQLNWTTIQYPLWYGVWDCSNVLNQTQKHSKLYFVSYDERTMQTEVIMQLDEDATVHLKGQLDFTRMILDLYAVYWYESNAYFADINLTLHFYGFLRILSDGSIIYAGSVQHDECMGFVFQGYANLAPDDDSLLYVDNESEVTMDGDSLLSTKSLIMFFVGMMSSFVIMGVVCLCLRWLQHKTSRAQYTLMNDDQL